MEYKSPSMIPKIDFPHFYFIGAGRFYDPRTRQSFKYDHLRKEASDYQPYESDATAESWRAALDAEILTYTNDHYRHGVSSVFGRSQGNQITLTVCIEDHQFQPNNFWVNFNFFNFLFSKIKQFNNRPSFNY